MSLPREYSINKGWNSKLAEQLVRQSNAETILTFTPNDALHRFPNEASAQEWYEQKQPVIYALSKAAELSGVIWYSENQRTDLSADYTFAIRMYDSARGKHLASDFMEFCEDDFRRSVQPKRVWLETDASNSKARNLYLKLGYHVVGASNARITMAK